MSLTMMAQKQLDLARTDTVRPDPMESRMRRKPHVRFGERGRGDRDMPMSYGAPAPTLCDPTPSPEDVRVTSEMVQAGTLLDIECLDHIIIGRERFVSLKERRLGFA